MATVKVVSAQGTAGGTGSEGLPWTLAHAMKVVGSDVEILCRGGEYKDEPQNRVDTSLAPVRSGDSHAKRVTIRPWPGEVPVFRGGFRIDGVRWLRLGADGERMRFDTNGQAWLRGGACQGLELLGVEFNSGAAGSAGTGINVSGGKFHAKRCKFLDWVYHDMTMVRGDSALWEECDFSTARGDHSLICAENPVNHRLRRCWIRNPMARGVLMIQGPGGSGRRNVLEDCFIVDCDWKGGPRPAPFDTANDDGSAVRFLLDDSILRNSVICGTNPGPAQLNHGQLAFSVYKGAPVGYSHLRGYHLVVHGGANNGLAFSHGADYPAERCVDNRFKNCSISANGMHQIAIRAGGIPWKTWRFEHCLLSHPSKEKVVFLKDTGEELTAAEAMAKYPEVFSGLLGKQPAYEDGDYYKRVEANPGAYGIGKLDEALAAYRLREGTAGHGGGAPLARVAANGTSDVVELDDARWFSDAQGLEEYGIRGDMLVVGSLQDPVEVAEVLGPKRLRLRQAVTVAKGDPVCQAATGRRPSIGIYRQAAPAPGPTPPPAEELLLDQAMPLPAASAYTRGEVALPAVGGAASARVRVWGKK